IWVIIAVICFVLKERIVRDLNVSNPAALWLTLMVGLPILWTPIFSGVLQGRQNFLWLGWISIMAGLGRCVAAFIIVRILGGGVTGAMAAVLLASVAPLIFCLWQTHNDWRGAFEPIQWGPWLRRLVPLTIGLGTTTVMFTADMVMVRSFFPTESGFYAAAATLGRALVLFTVPLAAVMFPKIVRSAALAEGTDVLAQALGATALMGIGAALFFTIFPTLPLRLVYESPYLVVAPLVRWFGWCMLPLTLANVLVNNLLARERFRIVPWLVLLAVGYVVTFWIVANRSVGGEFLGAFRNVVQVLGCFSSLFLAVAIYFTWRKQ
ncbi:MAG TPA: hypothetical protein VKM56_14605, partial [Verrucomicrobiae bacterium]|nr:hypothetical protein [Verrucomicrobiae bacterium]